MEVMMNMRALLLSSHSAAQQPHASREIGDLLARFHPRFAVWTWYFSG